MASNLLKLNEDRNDELWGFLVAMVISNSGELGTKMMWVA